MTYFFLGQDQASKDAKIREIKKKYLASTEADKFDYDVLYAPQLDSDQLKESLFSLPVFSRHRIVVVKDCHKLSPDQKRFIGEFIRNPGKVVLVLDSDKLEADDAFTRSFRKQADVINFTKGPSLDVFDLTRAIAVRKSAQALKILSQLLLNGEQPLQIMGGLIWYWKDSRRHLSLKEFKEGLSLLQEADFNIKRSRLKPEHALELLVVKLCSKEVC